MKSRSGVVALMVVSLACACTEPPGSHTGSDDDDTAPVDDAGTATDDTDAAAGFDHTRVYFAGSEEDADSETFGQEFGLLDQRDLIAVFDVPDESGVHFVKFDILNPQDALHQTIWRAISTDSDAPDTVEHPEIGQDFPVVILEGDGEWTRLNLPIPIAGTDFTEFRLTGTFTSQARIGMGEGDPVATGSFTMVR